MLILSGCGLRVLGVGEEEIFFEGHGVQKEKSPSFGRFNCKDVFLVGLRTRTQNKSSFVKGSIVICLDHEFVFLCVFDVGHLPFLFRIF